MSKKIIYFCRKLLYADFKLSSGGPQGHLWVDVLNVFAIY